MIRAHPSPGFANSLSWRSISISLHKSVRQTSAEAWKPHRPTWGQTPEHFWLILVLQAAANWVLKASKTQKIPACLCSEMTNVLKWSPCWIMKSWGPIAPTAGMAEDGWLLKVWDKKKVRLCSLPWKSRYAPQGQDEITHSLIFRHLPNRRTGIRRKQTDLSTVLFTEMN